MPGADRVWRAVRGLWRPLGAVAGLLLLMAYASGACHRRVPPGVVDHLPGAPLAAGAETVSAVRTTIAARVDLVGTTASDKTINLSARIGGYVQDVLASAGDRVKAGDLLVMLDDREVREQLAAAEAQLKLAESEFRRARQLFDRNAASEQELTAAESAFTTARAQVDRTKVLVSYARVTAPIDGVVTERRVEIGDLAGQGQVLLSVYNPARMRLEVPVPVRLLDRFQPDQELQVRLDYPARVVRARVSEIVSEIDPQTRTRRVKLLLEDAGGDILPGTFGRLWVEDREHEAVLAPAASVQRVGQLERVGLVQGDRVVWRLVRTRPYDDGAVEVLAGLQGGETILARAQGD